MTMRLLMLAALTLLVLATNPAQAAGIRFIEVPASSGGRPLFAEIPIGANALRTAENAGFQAFRRLPRGPRCLT
jgi:hypothetical protein